MKKYSVLGLMSGSSLDGLDIICVQYTEANSIIKWNINGLPTTEPIPESLIDGLKRLHTATKKEITQLDIDLGVFYGNAVKEYIEKYELKVDLVASHGHTVSHKPHEGYSLQIGSGEMIAKSCGIPCLTQFRSVDISKGGQGAPLAPVVEHYLFQEYRMFLNLGGISNISLHTPDHIAAFDVCPTNQLLNHLALGIGKPYDDKGKLAKSGKVDQALLRQLLSDSYHTMPPPKSLDNNYVRQNFIQKLAESTLAVEHKLATCVHYIAQVLARDITTMAAGQNINEILVTGGGVYNDYLLALLQEGLKDIKVIKPKDEIIQHKESILMALCGFLYLNNKANSFASATGAREDTVNGVLHTP